MLKAAVVGGQSLVFTRHHEAVVTNMRSHYIASHALVSKLSATTPTRSNCQPCSERCLTARKKSCTIEIQQARRLLSQNAWKLELGLDLRKWKQRSLNLCGEKLKTCRRSFTIGRTMTKPYHNTWRFTYGGPAEREATEKSGRGRCQPKSCCRMLHYCVGMWNMEHSSKLCIARSTIGRRRSSLAFFGSWDNYRKKVKFKDVPLSNFDLINWCRYLNIPIKRILSRNQEKTLLHSPCIINMEDFGSMGTHWVCCWPAKNGEYE